MEFIIQLIGKLYRGFMLSYYSSIIDYFDIV